MKQMGETAIPQSPSFCRDEIREVFFRKSIIAVVSRIPLFWSSAERSMLHATHSNRFIEYRHRFGGGTDAVNIVDEIRKSIFPFKE